MNLHGIMLQNELLRQISADNLTYEEKALVRCRLAKELEDAGNYEGAAGALGTLWKGIGAHPDVQRLGEYASAELRLRAGTLTGWLGAAKNVQDAQEKAKNLISESLHIFDILKIEEKTVEAQADLAHCYWRQGSQDEARVMLHSALDKIKGIDSDLKGVVLIRLAIVEDTTTKHQDALRFLDEAALTVQTSASHALKGKYHMTRAIVLKNLHGLPESKDKYSGESYLDLSIVEQYAATHHLELAGHQRFQARVENNLGLSLANVEKFSEAHQHLSRARILFESFGDINSVAIVDDTRAKAFLGEGRNKEAEQIAKISVRILEKSDLNTQLAESLVTYGVALARNGNNSQARDSFERAVKTAETSGDSEGAGLANLSMIEEIGEHLSADVLLNAFQMADLYLRNSQRPKILSRLLLAARSILTFNQRVSVSLDSSSFIHASEVTADLLNKAKRIAATPSTVLLTGETGTGKEVLAHLIHEWSGRKGRFVALNCGAITETLAEAELFGHRKGSFTDAVNDSPGAAMQAAGGTLFLDEIAELSSGSQAKILRLIDNREIHAVGAGEPQPVDVRIVAATNRSLTELVKERKFRTDLMYRLQVFEISIPPLRERTDDIPAIAEHFIKEACERHSKLVSFAPEALLALKGLTLKGNVRELRSLIERTVLMVEDGTTITAEAVETFSIRRTSSDHTGKGNLADGWLGCSLEEEVLRYEGELIRRALEGAKGSVTEAARLLGMNGHQGLLYILNTRHRALLGARTPAVKRRKSYITKKNKGLKK